MSAPSGARGRTGREGPSEGAARGAARGKRPPARTRMARVEIELEQNSCQYDMKNLTYDYGVMRTDVRKFVLLTLYPICYRRALDYNEDSKTSLNSVEADII